MMLLQAFVVGFVLFSFVEESFQEGFVRAIDMKAPGRMRAICESLCRSKREDGQHSKQEVSSEVCFSKCIRNKRSVVDSSRSRRNTNQHPSSEDECTTPKEYVRYYPLQPSSINVDYLTRKPNLSITWKPVRQDPYYNWTSYALHYFNGEEEDDHRLNPGVCKVLPKEQHEFIVQNGEGWNYPERIWVVIVTYPFGQYDGFKMQEFGPPPPSPPTFPPKESSDGTTKLIAATIGAVSGVVLLLVFIFLAYRRQTSIINLCKRGGEQRNVFVNPRNNNRRVPLTGDVEDNCVMSPKINNDLQFTDPKKKTGPDTFYACYFAESQWFQVQVASVVNYFRQNGYAVEMDVMNSSERIDLGPTRWAEQQIKKARNVLVFLSPGLLRMCGGDGEETDSSHQEHDRLWYELDILRKIYAQTHSARKMVCIVLPNMNIDPAELPLWAEMRYKWPEDEMNILKRLNDRPIIQPW